MQLEPGVYEKLVTDELRVALAGLGVPLAVTEIDPAESAEVLTRYIAEVTRVALGTAHDRDAVEEQVRRANQIIGAIASIAVEAATSAVSAPGELDRGS